MINPIAGRVRTGTLAIPNCESSPITGGVIATVGCAEGLTAQGGALGVGRAVRRAVIISIVLILVLSFDLTWLFYRAFET